MTRPIKIVLISAVSLMVIWFALRFSGTIQLYIIPTPSNEPTLKVNKWLWASRFSGPERGKFALFYGADFFHPEKYVFVYRVCGMPGDVVEIKDGVLYVNNKNFDESLHLKHQYAASVQFYESLGDEWSPKEEDVIKMGNDSVLILMDDSEAKKYKELKPVLLSKDIADSSIERIFSKPWNVDQFGPLKIPERKFFLLGDSRNNALDSRYRGLADQSDFVGGVISKK